LIDLPHDFYDEKRPHEDASKLESELLAMEATNLFLIQSCQELRHEKEQEDIRYEYLKNDIGVLKKKLEAQDRMDAKEIQDMQFEYD
jgi:hypothetical protein